MRPVHLLAFVVGCSVCAPSAQAELPQRTTTKKVKKRAAPRQWSFSASMLSFYDSDLRHSIHDNSASEGFILDVGANYRSHVGRHRIQLDYDLGQAYFSTASDLTRVTHNLKVASVTPLSTRATFSVIGSMSLHNYFEESALADDYKIGPRLEYSLAKRDTLGLGGGYRYLNYMTSQRQDSVSPYWETYYERDLRHGRSLEFRYRREFNHAIDSRYDYGRNSYTAIYTTPLSRIDTLDLRARLQERSYGNWIVSAPDNSRMDHTWKFGFDWEHRVASDLDLTLKYSFEQRASNDPRRNYGDHEIVLGLSASF